MGLAPKEAKVIFILVTFLLILKKSIFYLIQSSQYIFSVSFPSGETEGAMYDVSYSPLKKDDFLPAMNDCLGTGLHPTL